MQLYWFQNDLRTCDQPLLEKALKEGPVMGLYCFDSSWFEFNEYGFTKKSSRYIHYVYETVLSLKKALKHHHIDLYIVKGSIDDIIKDISKEVKIDAIYAEKLEGYEESKRYESIKKLGIPFIQASFQTLYTSKDLPYDLEDLPDIFTQFRKDIEYRAHMNTHYQELPMQQPTQTIHLSEVSKDLFGIFEETWFVKPGIEEAKDHLYHYFFTHQHAKTYKDTRNEMLRFDASTKFSLYLALGVLSPKMIMKSLKQYEKDYVKNDSTYWIYFELLWRDYFHFVHMKYGHKIFNKDGLFGVNTSKKQTEWIQKWMRGETGFPLIDANMRFLNQTGYMSNRGRQNVANFFTKVLNQDWRIGAAYFESQLLDFDVSSNTLNWLYVSGLGNDPREQRLFNIITQGERYDIDRSFVDAMVKELKEVPHKLKYQVSQFDDKQRDLYHLDTYPKPMIRKHTFS